MVMEIALGRQHRPQIFNRCCALVTNRPAPETACCVRTHDKKKSRVANQIAEMTKKGVTLVSW